MSRGQRVTDADIRARYRDGGLCGGLLPGARPAVLVVDLQYGFTEARYGPGFDLDDVVAATSDLVATARQHSVPVYFTTIAFPVGEDGIARTWLRKMPAMTGLRAGHRSVDIDHRLGMRPGDPLVVKQTASAFAHNDLATRLTAAAVDTVLVAGATTSGCVRATVVDACAADLPAFVVRECVGDREDGPHHAALLDIEAKYGEVISLATACSITEGLL
ncbi:isochorismatase family protein [Nocardia sp. NPDC003963]